MKDTNKTPSVIKIFHLPSLDKAELTQFIENEFEKYGEIKNIVFDCVYSPPPIDHNVVAFVEFADKTSANNAVTHYKSPIMNFNYGNIKVDMLKA